MPAIGNHYGREFSLTQLIYAVATRDAGSFSAAAKDCHVSQPALSTGIATLEQTLGVRLFERSATGASSTPEGQRLLVFIENILAGSDELFAAADRLSNTRPTIRLGVSPLVSPTIIAQTFDAFRSLPDTIEVSFAEANLDLLERDLMNGRLDIILVPRVQSDRTSTSRRVIMTEPLLHVGSQTSAPRRDLELGDLDGEKLVLVTEDCGLTEVTQAALRAVGATPTTHDARATSYQRLLEWADLGLGDAVLPESRVPSDRAAARLVNNGQPVTISYEAIWASDSTHTELISAAVDAMCASLD